MATDSGIEKIVQHHMQWASQFAGVVDIKQATELFRVDLVMWALSNSRSVAAAAKLLGLKRSCLSEMMARYGIKAPKPVPAAKKFS